jgi:hypothetical protein
MSLCWLMCYIVLLSVIFNFMLCPILGHLPVFFYYRKASCLANFRLVTFISYWFQVSLSNVSDNGIYCTRFLSHNCFDLECFVCFLASLFRILELLYSFNFWEFMMFFRWLTTELGWKWDHVKRQRETMGWV